MLTKTLSLEAVQVRGGWVSEEVHGPQQSEETHQEPQQGGAGPGPPGEGESEGPEGPADCGGGGRPQPHLGSGGAGAAEPLPGPGWEPQPDVRGRPRHLRLGQEGGGGEVLPVLQCSALPRGLNGLNKHFLSQVQSVSFILLNYLLIFYQY